MTTPPKPEIFIEFTVQGRFVKVTAIDPVSGTEVSLVGPAAAPQAALADAATRKLKYVLEKKKG